MLASRWYIISFQGYAVPFKQYLFISFSAATSTQLASLIKDMTEKYQRGSDLNEKIVEGMDEMCKGQDLRKLDCKLDDIMQLVEQLRPAMEKDVQHLEAVIVSDETKMDVDDFKKDMKEVKKLVKDVNEQVKQCTSIIENCKEDVKKLRTEVKEMKDEVGKINFANFISRVSPMAKQVTLH